MTERGTILLLGALILLEVPFLILCFSYPLIAAFVGAAGMGIGLGIGISNWFKKRHKAQYQKAIDDQLKNKAAILPLEKQKLLFSAISQRIGSYYGQAAFYQSISQGPHSEQAALDFFAPLSAAQKLALLSKTERYVYTSRGNKPCSLCYSLLGKEESFSVLNALMKDLSPEGYRDIIEQCLRLHMVQISHYGETFPLQTKMITLWGILGSLFKKMPVADKLKFLEAKGDSKPILLDLLNTSLNIAEPRSRYFIIRTRRDSESNLQIEKERLKQNYLEFLKALFEGIPPDALTFILATKYKKDTIITGPLDAGLRVKNIPALNVLIEKGALEADPEHNIAKLLENPGINITPYRDKLRLSLKDADLPAHMDQIQDIILDCLAGEVPRAKVIS